MRRLIGGRCKDRKIFSRAVLIGRCSDHWNKRFFFLLHSQQIKQTHSLGGLSGGVTPVPIPNTEVKPSSADDTRTQPGPGNVGRRQDCVSVFYFSGVTPVPRVCRSSGHNKPVRASRSEAVHFSLRPHYLTQQLSLERADDTRTGTRSRERRPAPGQSV